MEVLENTALNLLKFIIMLSAIFLAYIKWKFSYWTRIGLATLSPRIPYGDTYNLLFKKANYGQQFEELYKKFKNQGMKHGGVYLGPTAYYMPIAPNFIKNILQKDFQHFVNHGSYIDETIDPLTGHLFNLEDAKWKNMRAKLTPTFTSGKMKMMYETFLDCSVGLQEVMAEAVVKKSPVDIKDVLARFTTDIIGSCAFGLECNSLKNPDSEFRKYGKKIFAVEGLDRVRILLQFIIPRSILRLFKYRFIKKEVETFFMTVIQQTVNYREKNNIYRKDFMHLLLQLKNRGKVSDDQHITDKHKQNTKQGLTINQLAAQAFFFFFAGFEGSATTMTFALFEIAINPIMQKKLRDEIYDIIKKHDGKLTYDAIMEMTYMENVIYETLRKYPTLPILMRKCNRDYTIPNTNIRVEKDIRVVISVRGIHMDPDFYPDPEKFNPDRFLEKNRRLRPAMTWLPFGEGPRVCIGVRFAMMQIKVALATILKSYKIELDENTPNPLILSKKKFVTSTDATIWLNIEKID